MLKRMDEILKSNFQVKRPVRVQDQQENETAAGYKSLQQEFKERALASLGGSMVYVERTGFAWDPEAEKPEKSKA